VKKLTLAFSVICLLALAGPASAGIVFNNYPINGTIDAFNITHGFMVSDSFTLLAADVVTGVNFGAWENPGDTTTFVDWAIGTSPYDASLGSGTAAVSETFQFLNGYGYNINSDTFSFAGAGISLAASTTYYLTLQNAVVTSGDSVYWDENDGPGVDAWQGGDGGIGHLSGVFCPEATCAESFQITDNGAVPEPGSLMLFGSGLLLLAGAWRRKASR
jgi:hypothetical protein